MGSWGSQWIGGCLGIGKGVEKGSCGKGQRMMELLMMIDLSSHTYIGSSET
jgi:hypothetical protein